MNEQEVSLSESEMMERDALAQNNVKMRQEKRQELSPETPIEQGREL